MDLARMQSVKSKNVLIADCGGTSVDWCYIDDGGNAKYFSTVSYHPHYMNDDLKASASGFWLEREELLNANLIFFSSGCYGNEGRAKAEMFLREVGFTEIHVLSDLHAAAISAQGEENGWVAIMGTGSVLFKWEDLNIVELIGGKGHIDGDEGSGYYFGKLLIEKAGSLSAEQIQQISSLGIDLTSIDIADKKKVAQLAGRLSGSVLFEDLHRENFQLFIDKCCKRLNMSSLSIVGGYASANSKVLINLFSENGLQIRTILNKPIWKLVEHMDVYID